MLISSTFNTRFFHQHFGANDYKAEMFGFLSFWQVVDVNEIDHRFSNFLNVELITIKTGSQSIIFLLFSLTSDHLQLKSMKTTHVKDHNYNQVQTASFEFDLLYVFLTCFENIFDFSFQLSDKVDVVQCLWNSEDLMTGTFLVECFSFSWNIFAQFAQQIFSLCHLGIDLMTFD